MYLKRALKYIVPNTDDLRRTEIYALRYVHSVGWLADWFGYTVGHQTAAVAASGFY